MSASRQKLARIAAAGLALTAGIGWAMPSWAFRMIQSPHSGRGITGDAVVCDHADGFVHWTSSTIPWRLNLTGQGSGKQTSLQAAMASWTNVGGADHTLTYAGTTTASWAATDGINTVAWTTGLSCGQCLGLTALVLEQPTMVILEADIAFNDNHPWTTNGANYDTETVAAHEFGHALGIHHTELGSTPYSTMRSPYFGVDGRSLEADDVSALQCAQSKYPFTPPPTPAFLDVTSDLCFGGVVLEWTSTSWASSYQVQRSSSSSFTSPVTIYSGPELAISHDGGTGTKYYRVRGCNVHGCSGWRNGDQPGNDYNPCL